MELEKYIINVPNFPIEGIQFKDITPLLGDGEAFHFVINEMANLGKRLNANIVVGPEARGFIFASPVASSLKAGFVPIRKPNKLPRASRTIDYDLEYGKNSLSIHADAIKKGDRVLIVDDLLATGGTVLATIKLIQELGGIVVGCSFLIELLELKGRELLKEYLTDETIQALIRY